MGAGDGGDEVSIESMRLTCAACGAVAGHEDDCHEPCKSALADAHRLLRDLRKNILDYQVGAPPPAGTWDLIDRIDAHITAHGGEDD